MKDGPDIARLAALIGDPARANMLTALMDGRALTASELAGTAGVTPQTASSHLARLTEGGLLRQRKQGRHRYHALASDDVAEVLEGLMGLSSRLGARTRAGPKDAALREARVCYNHLAGRRGIQLYDAMIAQGWLVEEETTPKLTAAGGQRMEAFGIDMRALRAARAPVCRECLDWSERRSHLAGSLGRALFARIEDLGWARRDQASRAVLFTPPGLRAYDRAFPAR